MRPKAGGAPPPPVERLAPPPLSCLRLWPPWCLFQPAPSLAPVATDVPEPPQCCAQTQGQFAFLLSDQPRECRSQVLLLPLQSFPPQHLLRSLEVWLGLLRQGQVIQRVCSMAGLSLSALAQRFQPILANGLQHAEARLQFLLFALLQQALVQQGSCSFQYLVRSFVMSGTDRLDRL